MIKLKKTESHTDTLAFFIQDRVKRHWLQQGSNSRQ